MKYVTSLGRYLLVLLLVIPLVALSGLFATPAHADPTDVRLLSHAATAPELVALHQKPTSGIDVLDRASHNGFPAAAALSDGTLMVIYRLALYHWDSNGANPTSLAKAYSFDGGTTWTKPEDFDVPGLSWAGCTGITVPQYGPLAGRPIAVFETMGGEGKRETAIAVAEDFAGTKWGRPYFVPFNPWNTVGFPSSAAQQISSDEFLLVSYATNYGTASSIIRWSGSEWQPVRQASISGMSQGDRFTEGTAAPITDSSGQQRLIAMMREEQASSGTLKIHQAYSDDNGRSWSSPTPAFEGYGLPYVISAGPNVVVVSYRKLNASVEEARQWPRPAVYRISTDNGKTWGPEQVYGSPKRQMAYGVLFRYGANQVKAVWGKEDAHRRSTVQVADIAVPTNEAAVQWTIKTAEGGSILPTATQPLPAGSSRTIHIQADSEHEIDQVLVNGKPRFARNGLLPVTNVTGDTELLPTFLPALPEATPATAPTIQVPKSGSEVVEALAPVSGQGEAGAVVHVVSDDGQELCQAQVDDSGNWKCAPVRPWRFGPGRIWAFQMLGPVRSQASDYQAFTKRITADRLTGPDLAETLVKLADLGEYASGSVVYLANPKHADWTGGLATAAVVDKALVLAADSSSVPGPTKTALARIKPKRIVLVGGDWADELPTALKALLPGVEVEVSGGADPVAAAVRTSHTAFARANTVYLASDQQAVAATGAWSVLDPGPVLVTSDPNKLPDEVVRELAWFAPERVVLLGAEVSASAWQSPNETAPEVVRWLGPSSTGEATGRPKASGPVFLVRGDLTSAAAGAVAGRLDGTVLEVPGDCVSAEVAHQIYRIAPDAVYVVGNAPGDGLLKLPLC